MPKKVEESPELVRLDKGLGKVFEGILLSGQLFSFPRIFCVLRSQ